MGARALTDRQQKLSILFLLIFHSSLLLYPDCSFVDDFGPVLEYDLDYSWTDYWLTTVERFGNSGLGNR